MNKRYKFPILCVVILTACLLNGTSLYSQVADPDTNSSVELSPSLTQKSYTNGSNGSKLSASSRLVNEFKIVNPDLRTIDRFMVEETKLNSQIFLMSYDSDSETIKITHNSNLTKEEIHSLMNSKNISSNVLQ